MIKFINVSYTYPNGTAALKSVSLDISKGERIAIVGGNGSGKTTLALLINGILRPDTGRISVDGLDPLNDNDSKRLKQKVGLVFQSPDNQLVSTTVEREIAFSLENMNIPYDTMKIKVGQSLEFFGLSNFRDRLTSDLSGGEKQRLALASVMVAEPEILILDEPGSYLDESGKRLLDEAVARLLKSKEYLTVLRITQYAYVACRYERMVVFREGEIIADGDPGGIFSDRKMQYSTGIGAPLRYRIRGAADHRYDEYVETSRTLKSGIEPRRVTLDSVSFGYGNRAHDVLFDNLNLDLDNSRIYGLVGPSGSGKTTLIQLMAGLLKPIQGRISYGGFTAEPGRMAVSFQQSERQFFLDTVDREIRFGAENLALPDVDGIVGNCYDLIGFDRASYAPRNPFTLSGGEKRRLAFGTILSLRPLFIFFDEPTCALDYEGIGLFKKLINKLKCNGVGILIISHYGDIIFELADYIIALDNGTVARACDKKEFFREVGYSKYLSTPELVSFQLEQFGEIRFFSEREFLAGL
jgi:energy-coupling factor transport system ATP-binding protein